MAEITQEMKEKYLAKGGVACLFCESTEHVESGPLLHGRGGVDDRPYSQVKCTSCKGFWTDFYTLTSVEVD